MFFLFHFTYAKHKCEAILWPHLFALLGIKFYICQKINTKLETKHSIHLHILSGQALHIFVFVKNKYGVRYKPDYLYVYSYFKESDINYSYLSKIKLEYKLIIRVGNCS